jgi:hypothetical protein
MSYPDLPPGVTPSMIPGNRPEDEAEERFWEALPEHVNLQDASGRSVAADPEVIVARLQDPIVYALVSAARDLAWNTGLQEGRAEEQMAQAAEQADAPVSLALTPAVANVLLRPLRSKAESARNQRDRYQRIKEANAARGMVAEVDDLIQAFDDEERETRAILELVEGVIAHG